MSKRTINALEKVWMAEVEGRLPFQSNARVYHDLSGDGLIQPMEMSVPSRFGSLKFKGWQLTHAGRLLYCSTCTDRERASHE